MMIPDAELETAMDAKWRAFRAAIWSNQMGLATNLWRELEAMRAQRTPDQQARALKLAGLNPDGTAIEPKVESRV